MLNSTTLKCRTIKTLNVCIYWVDCEHYIIYVTCLANSNIIINGSCIQD